MNCTDKFLKHSERVGARFAEHNAGQSLSLFTLHYRPSPEGQCSSLKSLLLWMFQRMADGLCMGARADMIQSRCKVQSKREK